LAPILVVGGASPEREAIARAFHRDSCFHDRPFLGLDCSYDGRTLERALTCWLTPTSRPSTVNPLEAVAGGMLFLDNLECLPEATQRQLLLLSRRLCEESDAPVPRLPRRLAVGSRWHVPSRYGRRVIPELLDAVDKIRVKAGGDGSVVT
jgi:hypothetical protein